MLRFSSKDGSIFEVLDWGSSEISGIPLGDLCTVLITTRALIGLAAQCLAAYLQEIRYQKESFFPWLSYMARRWEELDAVRHASAKEGNPGGQLLLGHTRQIQSWVARLSKISLPWLFSQPAQNYGDR